MTFKYDGKVYKLVPDDPIKGGACSVCAFKDDNMACAASARKGEPDCIDDPLSHYEEVSDSSVKEQT